MIGGIPETTSQGCTAECCGCGGREKSGLQSQVEQSHMHKATPQLPAGTSWRCGSSHSHSLALQISERSPSLCLWCETSFVITQCDQNRLIGLGIFMDWSWTGPCWTITWGAAATLMSVVRSTPLLVTRRLFMTSVQDPVMQMAKDWEGRSFQSPGMYFSKNDRIFLNFSKLWLIAHQTKC